MVATLAISSAFFNALGNVITRVGVRHYNPFSAFVITLLFLVGISVVISLLTVPLNQFANWAALYFLAAGIMGPLIARYLLVTGIHRVGASIALPLHGTRPLFSAIAAVAILGESLTPPITLGILLIILGAATISLEESGGPIEKKWSRKDLIFPIMAAALFGMANIPRKLGLNVMPSPIVGVTVQNASALAFLPLFTLAQRNRQRVIWNERRAWFIFGLAGLSALISQLALFYALDLGQVVIVSPLVSLSPLFVLVLVGIFLRKLERLTWKIVVGAVLIVGGAAMLMLKPVG